MNSVNAGMAARDFFGRSTLNISMAMGIEQAKNLKNKIIKLINETYIGKNQIIYKENHERS
jgi:hypothetical protein